MATSLRSQLGQIAEKSHALYDFLERKSTAAYGPKAIVPSILFTAQEAADQDPEFVYDLAMNGMEELAASHGWWKAYSNECKDKTKNVSFGTGPRVDRSLMTLAENEKLDVEINLTLKALSPLLLLKAAQKILEFMIRRLRVHELNADALMASAIPYHETPIFHRILCTLRLKTQSRWTFLESAQESELPIPRSFLVKRCLADASLLEFLCAQLRSTVDNKQLVRNLSFSVPMSFFACLFIETVLTASPKECCDRSMSWLALLLHALAAAKPTGEWQLALYAVLLRLLRRMDLTARRVNAFDTQASETEEPLVSTVMDILARTCLVENTRQCMVLLAYLCGAAESMADGLEFPVKAYAHVIRWKNVTQLLDEMWHKYRAERLLHLFLAAFGGQCGKSAHSMQVLKEFLEATTLPDHFLYTLTQSAIKSADAAETHDAVAAIKATHPQIVASAAASTLAKRLVHSDTQFEAHLCHAEAGIRLAALEQLHQELTTQKVTPEAIKTALIKWPSLKTVLLLRMADESEKVAMAAFAFPFEQLVDPCAFLALARALLLSSPTPVKKAILASLVHFCRHGPRSHQPELVAGLVDIVYALCQRTGRSASSSDKNLIMLLETCESLDQEVTAELKGLFRDVRSGLKPMPKEACHMQWLALLVERLGSLATRDALLASIVTQSAKSVALSLFLSMAALRLAISDSVLGMYAETVFAMIPSQPTIEPSLQLVDDKERSATPLFFATLKKYQAAAEIELLGLVGLETIMTVLKARPAGKGSDMALLQKVYRLSAQLPASLRTHYLSLYFAIPTVQQSHGTFLITYWASFESSLLAEVSMALWLAHLKACVHKKIFCLDYQALLPLLLSGLAASVADVSLKMKSAILDILQQLLACYEHNTELPLWASTCNTPLSTGLLACFLRELLKERRDMLASSQYFILHVQRVVKDSLSAQHREQLVAWTDSQVMNDQTALVTRVQTSTAMLCLLTPFQSKEGLVKYQRLLQASLALLEDDENLVLSYLAALLACYDDPNGQSLMNAKARSSHFQFLLDLLSASTAVSLVRMILQFLGRHWTRLRGLREPVLEIVFDRLAAPAAPLGLFKEWLAQLGPIPARLVQKRLEACLRALHLSEEPEQNSAKKPKTSSSVAVPDVEPAIGLCEVLVLTTLSEGYILIPLLFEALKLSLPASHALRLEYYRQLILTCLERIFVCLGSEPHIQLAENVLRVDTLVSLLRNATAASLPTQRQALLALAALAPLAPRLALSTIFPIFIFMGSLSASGSSKVDDAYTFSMIEHTIATLLPIILAACQDAQAHVAIELPDTEDSADLTVPRVISMFVESFGHIPAHRRLVLFQGLVDSIAATVPGSSLEQALAYVAGALTVRALFTHPKKHSSDMLDFLVSLFTSYEWSASLVAQVRYLVREAAEQSEPPAVFLAPGAEAMDRMLLGRVLLSTLDRYLHQAQARAVQEQDLGLFHELLSSLMHIYPEFKNDQGSLKSLQASLTALWSPQWMSASQSVIFFEQNVLVHGSALSLQSLGMALCAARIAADLGADSSVYGSSLLPLLAHAKQNMQLATSTLFLEKEHMTLLFKLVQTIVENDMTTKSASLESKVLLALLSEMISVPISSAHTAMESLIATLGSLMSWLQMRALPKLSLLFQWLLNGLDTGIECPKRLLSLLQLTSQFVRHYGPCLASIQLGLLLEALLRLSVSHTVAASKDAEKTLFIVFDRLIEGLEPRTLLPVVVEKATLLEKYTDSLALWRAYFTLVRGMVARSSSLLANMIATVSSFDAIAKIYADHGLALRMQLTTDAAKDEMKKEVEDLVVDSLVSLSLKLNAESFKPFFSQLMGHMLKNHANASTSPIWYTCFLLMRTYFERFQALFVPYYAFWLPQLLPLMRSLALSTNPKWPTWDLSMQALRAYLELGPKEEGSLLTAIRELLVASLSQMSASGGKATTLTLYEAKSREHIIPCLVALVSKAPGPEGTNKGESENESEKEESESIPAIVKATHDALIDRLARHAHPPARVQCIRALMALYPSVDCGLLLLQETLPALAEWMEDEQPMVEKAAREFITSIEKLLGGETIQSYLR